MAHVKGKKMALLARYGGVIALSLFLYCSAGQGWRQSAVYPEIGRT